MITHYWDYQQMFEGLLTGALTPAKIAPVEITHLFIDIGSLICLLKLKADSNDIKTTKV
jgi:hypothetical protein